MNKSLLILATSVGIALSSPLVLAAPWGITANSDDQTISTVDFGTPSPTVYGPHLAGQLGTTGQTLDVAVAPNGQFGLVSNFGDYHIYRVDLSNPQSPSVSTSMVAPVYPEDITISADGTWATVTDGGSSPNLMFLNLSTNTLTNYALTTPSGSAQANVIIGQTVIVADYFGQRLIYGQTNAGHTALLSETPVSTAYRPVNLAVNPAGTLLIAAMDNGSGTGGVQAFTFSGGVLSPASSLDVGATQSVVFSPDGTRAYALTSTAPNTLVEIAISGSTLSLTGRTANLLGNSTSSFFGIDALAMSADGTFMIAGNPGPGAPTQNIVRVETATMAPSTITLGVNYPVGVALFGGAAPIPTLSELSMLLLFLMMGGLTYHMRRQHRDR